jgi:tetratricopeptide (TPR) repeat protein
VGGVHEDHDDSFIEPTPSVPGYFWEVARKRNPKLRDEEAAYLLERANREPLNPRWPYFAGQTLRLLGKHEEAIAQYEKAFALGCPGEMMGMSMFFASQAATEIAVNLKDPKEKDDALARAIDLASKGIRQHPGIAELFWQAAACEFERRNYEQAIIWAHHAALCGVFKGIGKMIGRSMEKVHSAQYCGPFDILRRSYGVLGMFPQATQANKDFEEALAVQKGLTG